MAGLGQGTLTSAYISPSTYLTKRDIRKKIFPRYREENLFDFLFHSGRKKVTVNERFDWWEDDYLYSSAATASKSGTNGAGNTATVTITSASHFESGTQSGGRVNDLALVHTTSGIIKVFVSAVDRTTDSAHVYTLKPIVATDNLVGNLASGGGDKIAFFSNAYADGTDQGESVIRKPLQFTNYTQIVKTQYEANGSESANQVEVEIDGKPYFYLKGVEDAANRHNTDIEFAMILGEQSTTMTDADGNTLNLTRGLESYVDNFGNQQSYSTFQYSSLTTLEKTLDSERAPIDIMLLNGNTLNIDTDGVVKGELDNNGIEYDKFGKGDPRRRYVDFGFDGFRFSNRFYHKKKWDALNYTPVTGGDLDISGGSASPYPTMGFAVPLDKVKDPKGDLVDTICLRYKMNDRFNRFQQDWYRDIEITNLDKIEFNHLSEVGLQAACQNQFVKLFKS